MSDSTRTTTLLALACAGAAAVLGASELMTTFQFTPPGGEALEVSQNVTEAADRHNYALLVLAVFALVALMIALYTGSELAAYAVAAAGVLALLIFLIVDLPDANKIGTIDDARSSFIDAKAEPQPGFWLELIGALLLAVCGGALTTVPSTHLALGDAPKGERRPRKRGKAKPTEADANADQSDENDDAWEWPEAKSRR